MMMHNMYIWVHYMQYKYIFTGDTTFKTIYIELFLYLFISSCFFYTGSVGEKMADTKAGQAMVNSPTCNKETKQANEDTAEVRSHFEHRYNENKKSCGMVHGHISILTFGSNIMIH